MTRRFLASAILSLAWCALLAWALARLWPVGATLRFPSGGMTAVAAAAAIPYAMSLFVRGWRWRVAFPGRDLPLGRVVAISTVSTFWVNVLPARTGEWSLLHLLKRRLGVEYSHTAGVLWAVRLCDVASLTSYGLLAVACIHGDAAWSWVLGATAGLAAVVLWWSPLSLLAAAVAWPLLPSLRRRRRGRRR